MFLDKIWKKKKNKEDGKTEQEKIMFLAEAFEMAIDDLSYEDLEAFIDLLNCKLDGRRMKAMEELE